VNELPDNVRQSLAFIVAWGLALAGLALFSREIVMGALVVTIVIEVLKVTYWTVKS